MKVTTTNRLTARAYDSRLVPKWSSMWRNLCRALVGRTRNSSDHAAMSLVFTGVSGCMITVGTAASSAVQSLLLAPPPTPLHGLIISVGGDERTEWVFEPRRPAGTWPLVNYITQCPLPPARRIFLPTCSHHSGLTASFFFSFFLLILSPDIGGCTADSAVKFGL